MESPNVLHRISCGKTKALPFACSKQLEDGVKMVKTFAIEIVNKELALCERCSNHFETKKQLFSANTLKQPERDNASDILGHRDK